jgi:glycyl-tRNA synthetase beta chain
MADKMDTVVGFFGIGTPVSGTSDPFGMRRRAIGILRVLLAKNLEVSLPEWVGKSVEVLGDLVKKNPEEVKGTVVDFFRLRYQQFLLSKGFPHDTIEAVVSGSFENVPDLYRRVEILHKMRSEPEFENLILGCKRAVNILQQAEKDYGYTGPDKPLREEDMEEDAEKVLLASTEQVGNELARLGSGEYEKVLQGLVSLKEPIDRLFDDVMILVDEQRTRENRLGLLKKVSELFQWFADFSRISL